MEIRAFQCEEEEQDLHEVIYVFSVNICHQRLMGEV